MDGTMMEPIKLTEPPSLARRRLSECCLLASESTLTVEGDDHVPTGRGRVSIVSRRASITSRNLAFSSTSAAFQREKVLPTVINAMIFLDDPVPDVERLRATLTERLLDIPRFRCVVEDDGHGGILWEPLARDEVDMTRHVAHLDGQNTFGPADIEKLVNDAYLTEWGADLPLWRSTLVTNLEDGRSLLFFSIDHAIGDGVGLLSVFLSLFDDAEGADGKPKTAQKERRTPRGLSPSHRVVAFAHGVMEGFVAMLPPRSDPPSCLMIPKQRLGEACPGKAFAQTRAFPLEEIKRLKRKMSGTTINDVVMALMVMTIHNYYRKKGDDAALELLRRGGGTLRAVFPVNMRRGAGPAAGLGNDFVFGRLACPGAFRDPVDCVWRVKTVVDALKVSPAFHIQKWIQDTLLPSVPDTVVATRLNGMMNRFTCMLSNVAGPSGEASLGGYGISDLNFTVAYSGGLYFGVLSYGGGLRVSGILDRRASGDIKELMGCFEETYAELVAALESVDEGSPLERPDATPWSARALEILVYAAIVVLPVFVASTYLR